MNTTHHPNRRGRGLFRRPHRTRGRTGASTARSTISCSNASPSARSRSRSRRAATIPKLGYDPLLEARMRAVLPVAATQRRAHHHEHGRGQSARGGAQDRARSRASSGCDGLKIAAVTGDDVLDVVLRRRLPLRGIRRTRRVATATASCRRTRISARRRSSMRSRPARDIVLTGRVADPSLFIGAADPRVRLAMDDWNTLGQATVVGPSARMRGAGHRRLFRRSGLQGRAGNLARLGFPIGEVERGRHGRHHEGRARGRPRDRGDLQGATALRDSRSGALSAARRGRGFHAGARRAGSAGSRARERRARHAAHRHAEGVGRLCRRLHRRRADFVRRSRRAGARAARARYRAGAARADRRRDAANCASI